MKYIYILLLIFLFSNCKNNDSKDTSNDVQENEVTNPLEKDTTPIENRATEFMDKSISIELKQTELIEKKDQRSEFQKLIIDKNYVLDEKDFKLNFKYPQLNESLNPKNRNFNEFIKKYYLNISKTIADIQESKMLCDSIAAKTFREERFIDYKIYIVNDRLVSVLFYKENFYSGAVHPTYSFDCFNFDLNKGNFMNYEDFFVQGTEDESLAIINKKIKDNIQKGDLYYDCWEVNSSDFFDSKNNFVLNETYLEFYFDDCVMCPSYTGTYSIQIPLVDLMSVLKKSNSNPLNL